MKSGGGSILNGLLNRWLALVGVGWWFGAIAQVSDAGRVWIVDNNPNRDADICELQEANDSSGVSARDTLYVVAPRSCQSAETTKTLHIVVTGFSHTFSLWSISRIEESEVGDLTITDEVNEGNELLTSSAGSSVMGLLVSKFYIRIPNVHVRPCNIVEVSPGSANSGPIGNLLLEENYMWYGLGLASGKGTNS